jgi:aurora kinase A
MDRCKENCVSRPVKTEVPFGPKHVLISEQIPSQNLGSASSGQAQRVLCPFNSQHVPSQAQKLVAGQKLELKQLPAASVPRPVSWLSNPQKRPAASGYNSEKKEGIHNRRLKTHTCKKGSGLQKILTLAAH